MTTENIIFKILYTLMISSEGPIFGICLENMLTGNNQHSTRNRRIFYWTAGIVITSIIHTYITLGNVLIIQNTVYFAWSYYILKRHYTEKIYIKLSAVILLVAGMMIMDTLVSAVYYFIIGRFIAAPGTSASDLSALNLTGFLACTVVYLTGSALQGIICMLWCRAKKKQRVLNYTVFLTGFILIGISILFTGFFNSVNTEPKGNGVTLTIYICLFFTACGAIFVLLNQMEKNEISKELEKIRQISSLEHVHYEAVEARREEMAEIRHDYNNILTSVLYLLNNGLTEEAEEMLSELSTRISATHENQFCEIPIINAVLAEKQKQCMKENIAFHSDILLPDSLPIDSLDLCSAFSNLVDIAIRACKKEPERENTKISLSCKVNKGYLIIKCVSTCQTTPGDEPDTSDCGYKILKNMAARYDGNFFVEYDDKKYAAQLSLFV